MSIYNLTTNEEPARGPVEDVLLTQLGLRSDRLVHLGAPHHPVVPEDNLTLIGCLDSKRLRVRLNRHLCFFRSKSRLLSMWLAPRINLRSDSTRLTCGPQSATNEQPKKNNGKRLSQRIWRQIMAWRLTLLRRSGALLGGGSSGHPGS